MVFSSSVFLFLFLPIVFAANCLIKKKYSNLLLLLASLVFYAWGEPVLVLLMIVSIIINWGAGLLLSKLNGIAKKAVLWIGIVCDLSILGYYKYAGFFAKTINAICSREILPVAEIALPIGISFFTFQAISYALLEFHLILFLTSNLLLLNTRNLLNKNINLVPAERTERFSHVWITNLWRNDPSLCFGFLKRTVCMSAVIR